MPLVFIPPQLKELTGGVAEVEFEAKTVREVIAELENRFPGIRDRLCSGDELSPELQVSIDHQISSRGMRGKVESAGEVHFLPALGGG
jgi:molybdopterin synthase sulfur carrier subunit